MSEKWVVVQNYTDWSGCDQVYGIFDSKQAAEEWAHEQGWKREYCQIQRIKNANPQEWA